MAISKPIVRTPGHLIRRLQQVSVAVFHSSLARMSITPVQFTLLFIIEHTDGLDQRTIAARAVLDTATVTDVLGRLEGRGLIARETDPHDRRHRIVSITSQGRALLAEATGHVEASRAHMLTPLTPDEQVQFLSMIERLLAFNEPESAAGGAQPWRRGARKTAPERAT